MKNLRRALASLLLVSMAIIGTASASSDDAWEEFRQTLLEKCKKAANAGEDSLIEIDLFGTQSYGVSIVYTAKGRHVCVMDKQTLQVELSEPF